MQHGVGDGGAAGVSYEKANLCVPAERRCLAMVVAGRAELSLVLRYLGETEQAMRMAEITVRPGRRGRRRRHPY